MLADHGQQLVAESHRSVQTRTLLHYNTSTIRDVVRESHSLADALTNASEAFTSQVEVDQGTIAELTISALALQRNRRAVLVYHQQRIDTLKDKFWENGGSLAHAYGEETDTRKHMATVDEAFARGYHKLMMEYKQSTYGDPEDRRDPGVMLMEAIDVIGGGVDAPPPRNVYVSVRILKDVGDLVTASGETLTLARGSQYYLQRDDVENLIVQGAVEIIE